MKCYEGLSLHMVHHWCLWLHVDDYGLMLMNMHSCGRLWSVVKDCHHIWSTIECYRILLMLRDSMLKVIGNCWQLSTLVVDYELIWLAIDSSQGTFRRTNCWSLLSTVCDNQLMEHCWILKIVVKLSQHTPKIFDYLAYWESWLLNQRRMFLKSRKMTGRPRAREKL